MNFDYNIISQRPNVGNSFDFSGGMQRSEDKRRMDDFRNLVSTQLSGGQPNMNQILGGMANIDPMKALQVQQARDEQSMNTQSMDPVLKQQLTTLRNLYSMTSGSNFGNLSAREQQEALAKIKYLENEVKRSERGGSFFGESSPMLTGVQEEAKPSIDVDQVRSQLKDISKKRLSTGRLHPQAIEDMEVVYQNLLGKYPKTDNKVQQVRAYIDTLKVNAEETARARQEQKKEGREDYKYYVETNLPNIASARSNLEKVRSGLQSALSQAKRAPAGGAYIAMKKTLGDALSGADFAGVAGFDLQQGMVGKIKELFNASQMTDEQAMEIVEASINSFNNSLSDYNDRFDTSTGYGKKAKKAYNVKPLVNDLVKKQTANQATFEDF